MADEDVPTLIDFRDAQHAWEWERTAQARPGRAEIFETFRRELQRLGSANLAVLDLGSGPGFLASHLLDVMPDLQLTLLDFSAAMHELARQRLGPRAEHVCFVHRNFRDAEWPLGLGPFDVVVTNQSVHELRHKRHAHVLHAAVRNVLKPGGTYLVSDHYFGDGGLQNDQLYMTMAEQRAVLHGAGFSYVERVAAFGSMVMHSAT
jgi:SAM-dependent methyltransferase